MQSTIERLKNKLSGGLEGAEEVFDLLAAACSYCCKSYTGGNESCPPKTELQIDEG